MAPKDVPLFLTHLLSPDRDAFSCVLLLFSSSRRYDDGALKDLLEVGEKKASDLSTVAKIKVRNFNFTGLVTYL